MTQEPEKSFDDIDDDFGAQIKTKTSSTGPDMIARRVEAREKEYGDPWLLFGAEFLEAYEYSHRHGALFDFDAKNLPSMVVSDKVKSYRRKLASHSDSLHASLSKLARKLSRREAVVDFFRDYYMQTSEIDRDAMLKKYGLKKGLVLLEAIELGKLDEKTNPDEMRHRLAAQIIAEKMARLYFLASVSDLRKAIPDALMLKILEAHKSTIIERRKKIEEVLPEMRVRLKDILHAAVDQGTLPVKHSIVDERLDALEVRITDDLVAQLDEHWGQFRSEIHTMYIAAHVPDDAIWKVFVHEALHALSGQNESISADKEYPDDFQTYDQTRIGLNISYGERNISSDFPPGAAEDFEARDHSGQLDFTWLNEAVTEQLTEDFIGQGWSYFGERALLNILIQKGIPKELFLQAYFENYETGRDGHKTPALKALFNACDARFGKGFLAGLDRHIALVTSHEEDEPFRSSKQIALGKIVNRLWENESKLSRDICLKTRSRVMRAIEGSV